MALKIHFLNVGHGDCTIVEHPDGKLTVIDINNGKDLDSDTESEILLEKGAGIIEALLGTVSLESKGYDIPLQNPVDYVRDLLESGCSVFRYVQTHPDMDHMTGIKCFEQPPFRPWNFWDTSHAKPKPDFDKKRFDEEDWDAYERFRSGEHCKVLRLHRGAEGKYFNEDDEGTGGHSISVLSPSKKLVKEQGEKENWNNFSYVLKVEHAGRTVILPGDAEDDAWEDIIQSGVDLNCDVLKASHHGRDSGYYSEALKLMRPTLTVVSVGKKPSTDAHEKYRSYSDHVWSTRWKGNIVIIIEDNGEINYTTQFDR